MKRILLFLLMALLPGMSVAAKPRAIISLDLCTDWMLIKYANPANVAALSPLSRQHPLDDRASSYNTHNGTLEDVLSLQPDMVITGEFNAVLLRKRLQALGINVEVLPLPGTLAGVRDYESTFFRIIDEPAVISSLVLTSFEETGTNAPTLLLLGANASGSGKGTLEDEMISRAGWKNYIEDEGYITLDIEQLVADPPDMLLWSAPGENALANQFINHPAIKKAVPGKNRIMTDFGEWQCQGPWTWQRIQQLNQARQQWHVR